MTHHVDTGTMEAPNRGSTMQQPTTYTEVDLSGEASALQIPMATMPCANCANAEPFGAAALVVWCTELAGHVPAGCSCPRWRPPLHAD